MIAGKPLSNITSINYSNTKQTAHQDNYYYDRFVESEGKSDRRYYYNDTRSEENIRVGIISNFVLELNPANKIEFRNLLNQLGNSQVLQRNGVEEANGNIDVNNMSLNYTSRRIYSGQLSGKHSVNDKLSAEWILGYSNTNAEQPDYKRIRSQRALGTNDLYSVVIPSSASNLDGRYYSDLNENVYTHALNLTYKLNPDADEKKQTKLQAGYYVARTERDFSARWFSYKKNAIGQEIPTSVLSQPFTSIFTDANIGAFEGTQGQGPYFILEEGTNFSDQYKGKNFLAAGYASAALPLGEHFRLSAGVRVEYNRQELNSFKTDGNKVNVDNPITSVMPFGNFSYNFTENSLVRLAYSKTINRPVFREIAPFSFYDFDRNADTYGQPNLKTADIHNVDLRWELYPTPNENLTLGVFYKYFKNPIEQILESGSNLIYTYKNGKQAYNYGVELEARKSLNNLTGSAFVDKFSVLFNAALIKSEIDLGADTQNQRQKRALQGQSPYVVNGGLYYNDVEAGWQFSALYNVFGPRIFAAGDLVGNSDQYELPRHQLDFTVSKTFSQRFEIKAGVQDILNQAYRLVQDSDDNTKVTSIDEPIRNFKNGQYITLGLTYRIK
jgi:TonB-dependent receptor